MSLIKGLRNILETELFDNGDVLVLQATTCTSDICRLYSIGAVTLTNDDLEYSYMTNLERICVFVRRVDIFNEFS